MKEGKTILLYHYTKLETLPKILESNLLRLTSASDTNDPFELTFQNLAHFSQYKPLLECVHSGVKAILEGDADTRKKTEQRQDKLTEDFQRLKLLINELPSYFEDNPFWFISLTGKMSSPSMWGHYADSHRGICLAFKIPGDWQQRKMLFSLGENTKNPTDFNIIPIIYTVEKPNLDSNLPDDVTWQNRANKLILDSIISKGTDWNFESEARLIVGISMTGDKKGECIEWKNDWPYLHGLVDYLDGVILGVRCPMRSVFVKHLLKKYDHAKVKVTRAKCSQTHYEIEAKGYSDTDLQGKEGQTWLAQLSPTPPTGL